MLVVKGSEGLTALVKLKLSAEVINGSLRAELLEVTLVSRLGLYLPIVILRLFLGFTMTFKDET